MTVRIVLNRKGVRDLLRSPQVKADLERRAKAIAAAAGPGHAVDSETGRNRARAAVFTDDPAAMAAEAKNHQLLLSIDAGR